MKKLSEQYQPPNVENPDNQERQEKLPLTASYEELEVKIPEVANMKNIDQRNDFHDLTLDEHTKKLVKNLEEDDYIKELPEEKRNLVLLAGKLHDLGKTSAEGQQVHPKDPEKRQYVGHEKESERMAREVLPRHFKLKEEDVEFIAKLAGLHASALNLVNNFEKNNQPAGKELKAYESFMQKVEEIPGDMDLDGKMRIVFALNKADKIAGFNEQSDNDSEKVKKIIEGAEKQVGVLKEMEKALPALIEAVNAKKAGDQKAGIILKNGEYQYKKSEQKKVKIPDELKGLGGILKNKLNDVAEIYETLKSKKGNEQALQGVINGVLRKKLGLNEEQIEKIIKIL